MNDTYSSANRKNGWSRITKAYSASCEGGKSKYIKEGNSANGNGNGIQNGKLGKECTLPTALA
ncbi:hypothetical protein ACYZT8_17215 [Pseudomonas sp. LB3P93]